MTLLLLRLIVLLICTAKFNADFDNQNQKNLNVRIIIGLCIKEVHV